MHYSETVMWKVLQFSALHYTALHSSTLLYTAFDFDDCDELHCTAPPTAQSAKSVLLIGVLTARLSLQKVGAVQCSVVQCSAVIILI